MALYLDDHQQWRANHPGAVLNEPPATLAQEDHHSSARTCPACARLMQRHRVGVQPDFWLDRCAPCQLVWFDPHEWSALVNAGLAGGLHAVLSDTWQRHVRENEVRAVREAALRSKHGDECIDELARIRLWLNGQPQRDELLALLRSGW
jgi:Zn-finger nucleic acid-binding protein